MASIPLTWTGASIVLAVVFVLVARRRAQLSQEKSIQIGLSKSPNHATGSEIWLLALKAASKHALALVGGTPTMIPDSKASQKIKLPHIYMQGLLHIDDQDVRLFNEAVKGKNDSKTISPMFLISQTIPLLIHVLADRACPVLPLGTVNTRNTFKIHRPQLARDTSALRKASDASKLSYQVYFGGFDRPGHRRKRGVEFCISINVLLGEEVIITQEIWILQFQPKSFQPRYVPDGLEERQSRDDVDRNEVDSNKIRIATKDPLKWAASTNDYNPIHVSAFGAKLFGFKSVIAHGNHLVALAVEEVRGEAAESKSGPSSRARRMLWEGAQPVVLEARFVRPTSLPAESDVTWQGSVKDGSQIRFDMTSRDKVCVSGSVSYDNAQE